MHRPTLLLIVIALVGSLAGCKKEQPQEGSAPVATPIAKAPAPPPEPSFEWTKTPTIESIPGTPIKGVLNGKPFEPKTILISEDFDGNMRDITISNMGLENEDDLLTGDDGIEISLASDIAPGLQVVKNMDDDFEGHCYYYYDQGEDKGPMSVNMPYSLVLVIEKGETGEYDPEGEFVQVTGSYTGKLAICFDDKDFGAETPLPENSYAAGTFEAKVRYWGPPEEASTDESPAE